MFVWEKTIIFNPSIILTTCPPDGHRGTGANPSWHWGHLPITGQPLTPMGNLESLINLTSICKSLDCGMEIVSPRKSMQTWGERANWTQKDCGQTGIKNQEATVFTTAPKCCPILNSGNENILQSKKQLTNFYPVLITTEFESLQLINTAIQWTFPSLTVSLG